MRPGPTHVTLILVAAPKEFAAAAAGLSMDSSPPGPWMPIRSVEGFELALTGIGKVNAAAAAARLLDPARHSAVLSAGIAGSLPGSALALGDVVAASACVYADEGLETDDGFKDCAAMGFPLGDFSGSAVPVDPVLLDSLRALAGRVAPIATVSTCSGSDALAHKVAARTGAVAEAMEGAAVAQVAHRLGVPAGELRVISNTTGSRANQQWDLQGALTRLCEVLGRLRSRA